MSTLDSLFDSTPVERITNPKVTFDWKTQNLRFRLGTDMRQLKLLIRHYVDGVGYVTCNQKPVRKPAGGFDLMGKCMFCDAKRALKKELEEKAANERRKLSKEETKTLQDFNRRYINLIGKASVEIREKNTVVKELEDKAIVFKASDMFFDHLTQNYKTLAGIYESKGTLLKHWFTMNGQGQILIDDLATAEEIATPVEVDLSYFDKQTKDYEVGVAEVQKKVKAVEEATPIGEEEFVESDDEDGVPF